MGEVVASARRRGFPRTPDGPLTPGERRDLVAAWLADPANRPVGLLVHCFPATYGRAVAAGLSRDEIESTCLYAVCLAARKFDPARSVRFSVYVVPWLRGTIQQAILPHERWRRQLAGRQVVSGHDRRRDGTVFSVLPAGARTERGDELAVLVRRLLSRVEASPKAVAALWLRWGLGGESPMSRDEVGERLGISGTRVWQFERRAANKLRPLLAAEGAVA